MDVRILGPLEVVTGGRTLDLRGPKQRALLAILVVHANEIVSPDTLIDDLWPDEPPPSASKTLQAHISRLRDILDSATDASGKLILQTHPHGYRLVVDAAQLDAKRFEDLLEVGRRQRADGDANAAAATIRGALDLWRGPALAEFVDAPFALHEIARLDELRLGAIEDRVEADLELGRHRELIPELEGFVRREPLRERARGQLMTALYRSGRQAEALRVYQEGRRQLADDLGVEPSETLQELERRILRQDPELAPAEPDRRPAPVRIGRARIPRWAVLAGAVGMGAVVGVTAWGAFQPKASAAGAAGALVLDPATGTRLGNVALGTSPSSVATGEGGVWVIDADDRTVTQLDPVNRTVRRIFSTATTPTDIAVGAGAVWIGNADPAANSRGGALSPGSVDRLDPATGDLISRIALPPGPAGSDYGTFPAGISRRHLAVTADAIWAIGADGRVSRIDPRTNTVVATVPGLQAENIAAAEGEVWATKGGDVIEIDPTTDTIAQRFEVTGFALTDIAIGAGSVWVPDPVIATVWRIGSGAQGEPQAIGVAPWVAALAFGQGGLWAVSEIADEIQRIDPRTNTASAVGSAPSPRGVDAGSMGVWVTVASDPSRSAGLPSAICSDVYYKGSGEPDLILTSNLPIQGGVETLARSMVDGFRFVLEQRSFEAGTHRVGFAACDTSTAQSGASGGSDFFRCGTAAKAVARDLKVVGVMGTLESPCALMQIPIANEAPEGPLVMVSPSNTDDALTEDADLYPTGVRNYTRIALPGRFQGDAQVELVKQLGASNVYFLTWTPSEFEGRLEERVRTTAKERGIELVGDASFDPETVDPSALAAKVAAAAPGAVIIAGGPDEATGALIRELRSALAAGTPIIVPDTFSFADGTIEVLGPAAQGLYVTNYGTPNDGLPPRGKRFLEDYQRDRGSSPGPDGGAAYGAQAAEILLDAIAGSDGTRKSVAAQVFRTDMTDGILGPIRFDADGDPRQGDTTIYRLQGDAFVVDRVITTQVSPAG